MKRARAGGRRRFTPIALLTGVVGVVLLALSMTSTLSAFTASITDSGSVETTAAVAISEVGPDGNTQCNSTDSVKTPNSDAASCTSIDAYGGTDAPLAPGDSTQVTVVVTNTGTVTPDDFNLSFGDCVSSPATKGWGDLCAEQPGLEITVSEDGNDIVGPINADDLEGKGPYDLDVLDPGQRSKFTFTLSFSPKSSSNLQGAQITQPVTWTVTG
jgi:hypothetical protein